jgi:hypothetical protein
MPVILLLHWYCVTTMDKCLKVKATGSKMVIAAVQVKHDSSMTPFIEYICVSF